MPLISLCPDPRALQQFLLGKTTDYESISLERHLGECDRCADLLELLAAHDTLVDSLQASGTRDDEPSDSVVALMSRLSQLPVITPPPVAESYDFLAPSQSPEEAACCTAC